MNFDEFILRSQIIIANLNNFAVLTFYKISIISNDINQIFLIFFNLG